MRPLGSGSVTAADLSRINQSRHSLPITSGDPAAKSREADIKLTRTTEAGSRKAAPVVSTCLIAAARASSSTTFAVSPNECSMLSCTSYTSSSTIADACLEFVSKKREIASSARTDRSPVNWGALARLFAMHINAR